MHRQIFKRCIKCLQCLKILKTTIPASNWPPPHKHCEKLIEEIKNDFEAKIKEKKLI